MSNAPDPNDGFLVDESSDLRRSLEEMRLSGLRSERRFQGLIDHSFDVIMIIDKDGYILYASPSVERVLGYKPAEIITTCGYDYIHERDRDEAREAVAEVCKVPGGTDGGKIRTVHKNGKQRTLEYAVVNLLNDSAINGVVLNFRDVSDRVRAEEALRLSEELFVKAFRSSADSITVTDLKHGRFVEVNEGFERITGYSRDEIIGKTSKELQLWTNPTERSELINKLKTDGVIRNYEAEFRVKSGEVRQCLVSAETIEAQGRIWMVAVTEDITDLNRHERKLKQTTEQLLKERQELIEKNIALEQILNHLEKEKAVYKHDIATNVAQALTPILERARKSGGALSPRDLELLETALRTLTEEDVDDYRANMAKLTPRELDICELLGEGLSSKEIAERLGLSAQTVHKHRQLIRRKLQLDNKNINLASFLRSKAPPT